MNRRTFLQGVTAILAGTLVAREAHAQTPTPEQIAKASTNLIDAFEKKIQLETVPTNQTVWMDGFSDGTRCTFHS